MEDIFDIYKLSSFSKYFNLFNMLCTTLQFFGQVTDFKQHLVFFYIVSI